MLVLNPTHGNICVVTHVMDYDEVDKITDERIERTLVYTRDIINNNAGLLTSQAARTVYVDVSHATEEDIFEYRLSGDAQVFCVDGEKA